MFEYFCKVNRVVDGDTIDVTVDLGFDIHHSNDGDRHPRIKNTKFRGEGFGPGQ